MRGLLRPKAKETAKSRSPDLTTSKATEGSDDRFRSSQSSFHGGADAAGVAVIVFCLLRIVPGDPIAMMISPSATPADIAALRAHYGLDLGLPQQFGIWFMDVLKGNFGTSISQRRDVMELIGERLPATLELAFAALVFGVLAGGVIATLGTLARRTALDPALDFINGLFLAVPDFVWALALVLLLGVFWRCFRCPAVSIRRFRRISIRIST